MLERSYSEKEENIYLRFLEKKFGELVETKKPSEFWRRYANMEKSMEYFFPNLNEKSKLCLFSIDKELKDMIWKLTPKLRN